MFQIVFHPRTLKQLNKLPKQDKTKILKKISQLKNNPTDPNLNIRPYYNTEKSWRIRAGNLRVIYHFNTAKKIIYIEYLGYRGKVYK